MLHATQQYLGIVAGIVSMCCQGINNCKSGISKKDGQRYKFEYVKKEDLPDDYNKSMNIRPKRVSDKWQYKEYTCQKCGNSYKNGYKYKHNKRCL